MRKKKLTLLLTLLITLATILLGCNSQEKIENASSGTKGESSENWPTKPITIIVPTGEGGSNDRQARALAPYLQEYLGVPVTVENRDGGASIVGTISFLQQKDDGQTLFYPLQYHFSGGIMRGGEYSVDDFATLGVTHEAPIAVWVKSDSPYQTVEDLIQAIKDNPGKISVGYQPGSASHIAALVIKESADNVELKEVPYDGGGDQRAALLGGHIDFMTSDYEGTVTAVGDEAKPLLLFSQTPHVLDESIPLSEDILSNYLDDFTSVVQNFRLLSTHASFKEQYPERFEILREALEKTYENPDFLKWAEDADMYMSLLNIEASEQMFREADETIKKYKDLFNE
ncbi:tripartite tricarboxylate transporter substrate binding protein [Robertmurraya massiliosenegalensis]|uniref:tripartite tricarboxylate transporter substrate binding protein n=1 Tax=Robertmurraya TaxID=2837507 RepID=UPI0039A47CC8